MATVSANKLELLQIAEAVAREKSIDRRIVLGAMEDAIAKAARSRYGSETEVRAAIDRGRSPRRSPAKSRSIEGSYSAPWRTPSPRRRVRATAAKPRCVPRSIA